MSHEIKNTNYLTIDIVYVLTYDVHVYNIYDLTIQVYNYYGDGC